MRARMLVCLVAAFALSGGASAAPRTVLELFTSQGCSSCPPADRLFAQLAHDPRFVVLSLPVDYWDRLGWKDTLARHAFTERQQAYAAARGDGQVYTPQAVVNGSEHANGANLRAIDAAAEVTTPLAVAVDARLAGEDVEVSVGAGSGSGDATIVLMPYVAAREVAVGRGENARSKITYTNVVREIIPVGAWSGVQTTYKAKLAQPSQYDGVVVLLQAGTADRPGAILGAAQVPIHPTG